jgi:membrane protease YdiL (CAAX protease family)
MNSKSVERTWTAKNAWIYLLLQIAWVFVCNQGLRFLIQTIPAFASWLDTHLAFAENSILVLSDCWLLLAAFLCSKSLSVHSFIYNAGLSRRLTLSSWLFACGTIGIALLNHYGVTRGWTAGNQLVRAYHNRGGETWSLFTLYTVSVTPFAEEVGMRGFLYRAFRGSYGFILSILLIICMASFFHWDTVSRSLFSFACLCLFQILLCIIRERTGNTWSCVICHAAYNAIALHQWGICFAGMLVLLTYCAHARGRKPRPARKIELFFPHRPVEPRFRRKPTEQKKFVPVHEIHVFISSR